MDTDAVLTDKLTAILPHLNEKQRRLLLAAEARSLGRGGVVRVSRASGVSRPTITKAMRQLKASEAPSEEVRRAGAGRKRLRERDPALITELEALVEPDSRGDPLSPLRWTCKSTRQLADTLTRSGHTVSNTSWRSCSTRPTTACKPTSRRWRERSIRIGTPSSTTSTSRSKLSWPRGCR